MFDVLYALLIYFPPLFLAVTFHEAAHGYADKWLASKPLAYHKNVGLSPLQHIHPVGTIVVPTLSILIGHLFAGVITALGWGRPAPVHDYHHLIRYKRVMVALAGPCSHLVGAYVWAGIIYLTNIFPAIAFLEELAVVGVWVNIFLMIINLLPILPLDGGRIVEVFLPDKYLQAYQYIQPAIIVLLLIATLCGLVAAPLIELSKVLIIILMP